MNIIVPLAGPDYFNNKKAKGLEESINKTPQLYHTLKTRPWYKEDENEYTFILKDSPESRAFASQHIKNWFKNANYVFLSKFTQGAAFSAISSISFHNLKNKNPLIFDLADIFFETDIIPNFKDKFSDAAFLGYSFKNDLPIYSYYKIKNGRITFAAEKKVISDNASAGVYVYKNTAIFLEAFSNILKNPTIYLYNDLLYIAPIVNGLINEGRIAKIIEVKKYKDYKN